MNDGKPGFLEELKNNLIKNYYLQQDSLFKFMYDKYYRKDTHEEILNTDFSQKNSSEINSKRTKFIESVKWFKLRSIEGSLVDKKISSPEKDLESKTYQYFKYHTFIIKGQFFLYFLSATTLISGGVYLLVRSNYKLRMLMQSVTLGLIITILPLNIILLIMVNRNYAGKDELLSAYRKELKIYDKFYLKNRKK
jgi:hypothetical protein